MDALELCCHAAGWNAAVSLELYGLLPDLQGSCNFVVLSTHTVQRTRLCRALTVHPPPGDTVGEVVQVCHTLGQSLPQRQS